MKILIYGNRKQDPDMYDISTPEKEAAAYLQLFKYLDEHWQVYCDLEDDVDDLIVCEPCAANLHRHCEGHCACDKDPNCKTKSRYAQDEVRIAKSHKRNFDLAKAGDAAAAKKLLNSRKENEYEEISFGSVIDPLAKTEKAKA
jgi:hypothetical protein